MDKILIIIRKEYVSRVKTKSFFLITFLSPLFFALLIFAPLWLSGIKSSETQVIGVADDTGLYLSKLPTNDRLLFVPFEGDLHQELARNESHYQAILTITDTLWKNPKAATLYSIGQISPERQLDIRRELETLVQQQKIASYGIDNLNEIIQQSQIEIPLKTIQWQTDGEGRLMHTEAALGVAMTLSFLIYLFITLYGTQVMNGVIEEKSNRIVEILLSTIKPVELMMGKIVGVALVGLTQFLLWGVLTALVVWGISFFSSWGVDGAELLTMNRELNLNGEAGSVLLSTEDWAGALDWAELIGFFLLYFIGGYMLYGSLFAAVGAAIDNPSDAQQFMLPLMLPLIFAIYAGIYGAQNPEGPLAFWCSLIPFTSPVVMMARLPFEVPLWEKLLSIGLLIGSFMGTTLLSARIYRNGILKYGQKSSYKEIFKWLSIK